jgi:hypothetical protein
VRIRLGAHHFDPLKRHPRDAPTWLPGGLARAACETVFELMCVAAGDEGMRPGMVTVVQTAGDLRWAPHLAFLTLSMGDRVGIEIEDFIRFFEHHSEYTLEDLRSCLRRPALAQARIELATLAATRYGLRSTDLARYIQKYRRRLRVGSVWRSAAAEGSFLPQAH